MKTDIDVQRAILSEADTLTRFVVDKGDNYIRVYPKDKSVDQEFSASVDSDGYFEFNVKSGRNVFGQPFPGFYAREITILAYQYLSSKRRLNGIKGVWKRKANESTNFKMFQDGKKERLTDQQSALQTWTGSIAKELRLTTVRISTEDPSYLWVYFEKP